MMSNAAQLTHSPASIARNLLVRRGRFSLAVAEILFERRQALPLVNIHGSLPEAAIRQ